MKLSKSSSYALIEILNGSTDVASISEKIASHDVRSIQRAVQRLVEFKLISKQGPSNSPSYVCNFAETLHAEIPEKVFDDEERPRSYYRFKLIEWLDTLTASELDGLFFDDINLSVDEQEMSAKDLEHLTVELSWKSSALEGNTYSLLDTQLLLTEGVRAKNRTEFETQMILNHKDAVLFITENPELFNNSLEFKTVEQLHRIIGNNLGIDKGVRKKIVRITASNYEPLASPQQLREQADNILSIINKSNNPYTRSLFALTLVPYLQIFEDGNKRTGRILANALLITSVKRGFSLRGVDARQLAIAYLKFYEFSSMQSLHKILQRELK